MYLVIVRCREKQRKEASRLQTVNRKLSAMNKLLMEENDRLQKQVSRLVYENGYMRTHLNNVRFIPSHTVCVRFMHLVLLILMVLSLMLCNDVCSLL
jgi:hypothetical protein